MTGELTPISPGLSGVVDETVTEALTAREIVSGDVSVLATPVVVQLVERAAVSRLAGHLAPDETTVGSSIRLAHTAPTPVGGVVRAEVRVEAWDGRRVTFSFRVLDEIGEVANGTHDRVVVGRDRFERTASTRRRAGGRPG